MHGSTEKIRLLLFTSILFGNTFYAMQPTDTTQASTEIGKTTVEYIKQELKEPYLQLLSSSDLATWKEVQTRFKNVEDATAKFKQKYANELTTQATPATTPMPVHSPVNIAQQATESTQPSAQTPDTTTTSTPTTITPQTVTQSIQEEAPQTVVQTEAPIMAPPVVNEPEETSAELSDMAEETEQPQEVTPPAPTPNMPLPITSTPSVPEMKESSAPMNNQIAPNNTIQNVPEMGMGANAMGAEEATSAMPVATEQQAPISAPLPLPLPMAGMPMA